MTFSDKIAWAKTQDWFKAMEFCGQNPKWHREGNVMNHTMMVCEAMEKDPIYKDLSDYDKDVVEWAQQAQACGAGEMTLQNLLPLKKMKKAR